MYNATLSLDVPQDILPQMRHLFRPLEGATIEDGRLVLPVNNRDHLNERDEVEAVIEQLKVGYSCATLEEARFLRTIARTLGFNLEALAG